MEKEILVLKIADEGSDRMEISKEVFIISSWKKHILINKQKENEELLFCNIH